MKVADQSRGTQAWLRLLVAALTVLERGSTLCVDEIDSSLHPRLTARLVELFRGGETNPAGAQLIFTTHDATLLGTSFGQDVLSRDEVWFVEKGTHGASKVFPLTDFHPRREENTERRYLGGSYGAIPDVSEYEFRRAVAESFEAV
jgi:AAA15 family ATPase/GTPase